MSSQLVLDGIHTRLLSRPHDPPTSKAAARELVRSGRLTAQQNATYAILCTYGPGTAKEIAIRFVTDFKDAAVPTVYHKLCRRLPELERKYHARVQQDRTKPCRCKPGARECHCQDVVRGGCRVWEAVKGE